MVFVICISHLYWLSELAVTKWTEAVARGGVTGTWLTLLPRLLLWRDHLAVLRVAGRVEEGLGLRVGAMPVLQLLSQPLGLLRHSLDILLEVVVRSLELSVLARGSIALACGRSTRCTIV